VTILWPNWRGSVGQDTHFEGMSGRHGGAACARLPGRMNPASKRQWCNLHPPRIPDPSVRNFETRTAAVVRARKMRLAFCRTKPAGRAELVRPMGEDDGLRFARCAARQRHERWPPDDPAPMCHAGHDSSLTVGSRNPALRDWQMPIFHHGGREAGRHRAVRSRRQFCCWRSSAPALVGFGATSRRQRSLIALPVKMPNPSFWPAAPGQGVRPTILASTGAIGQSGPPILDRSRPRSRRRPSSEQLGANRSKSVAATRIVRRPAA